MVVSIFRFISDNLTYVRENRALAIDAALDSLVGPAPPSNSVILTSVPDFYPHLREFTNAPVFSGDDPSFIWDSQSQNSGDLKGFAVGRVLPNMQGANMVIFLQVFADNAHNARLSLYDSAKNLVTDLTPVGDLRDGDMNPITGAIGDTQPPYQWQNVRYYSNLYTFSDLTPLNYALILSFEVSNYVDLNNAPTNPAALAFIMNVVVDAPNSD